MKNQRRKLSIGLASLAVVLVCAVGGTLAWVHATSNQVTNTFQPASVTTEVTEDLGGGVKSNVQIQNTGEVDAFIRATVVVNLVGEDGSVSAITPVKGEHYTMEGPSSTNWFQVDDYYYYSERVTPGGKTDALIDTCKPAEDIPKGMHLQVTILAEGIQADGTDPKSGKSAAEIAWNVVKVDTDGTLIEIE